MGDLWHKINHATRPSLVWLHMPISVGGQSHVTGCQVLAVQPPVLRSHTFMIRGDECRGAYQVYSFDYKVYVSFSHMILNTDFSYRY